jgi:hypothetical protein
MGRTAGNKFSIYDYRYRYLPEHGNVMHGGQKIVVFRDRTYVGQYALSPPYVTAIVNRTHVLLRTAVDPQGTNLDFSRGPPRQILVGGEIETFFR